MSTRPSRSGADRDARPDWISSGPFVAMHLLPLGFVAIGLTWGSLLIAIGLYLPRMFFVTAGYHRYFAHRTYRLGRVAQFVMALGASTAAQKGPLWWAGHHRRHHRHADQKGDIHSPRTGFWWSHVGWILARRYKETDLAAVPDLAVFPELRALDRLQSLAPIALGAACTAIWGWRGVCIFALSTVALWHATFSVNSVAHRLGRRRYDTPDDSRNCWPVALLTLGEGWHNNHHHYPRASRQGQRIWELDPTDRVLRVLAGMGIVRDMTQINERALASRRVPL
jgi:stearoyl-CoA desaturase (Delta-9 desaturase)